MKNADRNLIISAVILCLVIGALAPFIASSNPDGLEKSAEQLMNNPNTEPVIQSPFPDYSIESLGELGGVIAMFIGIIATLLIAYTVAMIIKRRNPPEMSE